MRSIGAKHTAKDRPKFDYTFDNDTGEITVTIPWQSAWFKKAEISYAETLQDVRRDFRWVILAGDKRIGCALPFTEINN